MEMIDDVAVGVVLDAVAEGIAPVVEDLAAEQVTADAAVEPVAARLQILVRAHHRVDILHSNDVWCTPRASACVTSSER